MNEEDRFLEGGISLNTSHVFPTSARHAETWEKGCSPPNKAGEVIKS